MQIFPDNLRPLTLEKEERQFISNISQINEYGYLLVNVNPTLMEKGRDQLLIRSNGIILFRFFNVVPNVQSMEIVLQAMKVTYEDQCKILATKLGYCKSLKDDKGNLKVRAHIVYVFPHVQIEKSSIMEDDFLRCHCMAKDEIQRLKKEPSIVINDIFRRLPQQELRIDDSNINTILQRLAPEYMIVQPSEIANENTFTGVDEQLLIVSESDAVAQAFQLDSEQINFVNRLKKGEQLILACAGSGKSVLLIARCFKAAAMYPEQRFLITCYGKRLNEHYKWLIDMAGLSRRNVECETFHGLCKKILDGTGNGVCVRNNNFDEWSIEVARLVSENRIKSKYFGIFIDEVQLFKREWYKICFNLLNSKQSEDHIFVICGDKTQDIKKRQKHGQAPWNAGEGYPNYTGKSVHIKKITEIALKLIVLLLAMA